MTERKQRRPERASLRSGEVVASGGWGTSRRAGIAIADRRLGAYFVAILLMTLASSCATTTADRDTAALPPVSIQPLQYYPFQVKGYQKSFPNKRIMILTTADARSFKDIGKGTGATDHAPYEGHPAIGVILDRHSQVAQRLYGPELAPLVREAIAQSAQEAGMISSTSPLTLKEALKTRGTDYVLEAKVTGLWVVKQHGTDTENGPSWFSAADVMLDVTIYKPPFAVPFWQGQSVAEYNDPPTPSSGMRPEDATEIYDQPGEVLSVALTRAVAGIFRRDDLHTLAVQDAIPPR